jgi:FMN-dependent NADH-azoreductase
LKGAFGFIGFTGITFIRAEGIAVSADARTQALSAAQTEITQIAA